MGDAGVHVQFDGYPGVAEGERVGDVLVAEDVELADLDVGRWEAGGVGESGGGGCRVDRRASTRSPSRAFQPVMLSS